MAIKIKNGFIQLKSIIFSFALIVLTCSICYGFSGLQLTNISVKDGLSNLNTMGIVQDKLGYIWIATMRGLNRYNGSEFTHYYYNPKDTTSINSNHVNALLTSEKEIGRAHV